MLVYDTHDGRDFATCVKCDRHYRRECIDCGRPHGDLTRQRLRCAECGRIQKNKRQCAHRWRVCRNPKCDMPVKLGSKRQYCCDRCLSRKKTLDRKRKYQKSPKLYRAMCRRKKKWRKNNPHRLLSYKRKGRLDGTWGYRDRETYLAAMAAQNKKPDRVKKHSAWARDNQRKYGPHNHPRCLECGRTVAWSGKGRPPLRHSNCPKVAA